MWVTRRNRCSASGSEPVRKAPLGEASARGFGGVGEAVAPPDLRFSLHEKTPPEGGVFVGQSIVVR
jgi:hypothetical protein